MPRLAGFPALLLALAISLVALSCASPPPAPAPEPQAPAEAAPEVAAAPLPEPLPTPEPVVEPTPAPESAPAPEPAPEPELPPPPAPEFDPSSITQEVKTAAFDDVRALIETLNGIIQRRDYESWLKYLAPDYIATYSDPPTLQKLSESTVLKRLGISLRSLRDYFLYVVYPSRQNDRVDDIEFIGERQIRAITVNQKGERFVLYNLQKISDAWKIGIGR